MKTLITFSLLIGALLTNMNAQQITFQSYMSTVKWAESVTLNGNPLNESASDVFDIPANDVLPGTNIIEFTSLPNTINGVSSLDLVLIRRALFNIAPLPVDAVIPADFDKSGFIGVNDLSNLSANILGIFTSVENSFIHPSLDLATLDPFDFGTDVYKFEFQGEDLATTNFVFDVYLHGDVNQSAMFAPAGQNVEVRESNTVISIEDIILSQGSIYDVPFRIQSEKQIEALQLGAVLDGITINDIYVENNSQRIEANISTESLKMLMIDEEPSSSVEGVFSITANRDGLLSELISLEQNFLDEVVFDDLTTSGLEIQFSSLSSVGEFSESDVLLSPNPVVDVVTISFPENALATQILISNAQGLLLASKKVNGSKAQFDRSEFSSSGVYFITIVQEGKSIQKKVIVL